MTDLSRRQFLAASAASSLAARSASGAAPAGRPNIVLVMADDMGYSDLGCYGSEISTPNLDGLARGGVRFTQFYNAARCCPTRASLLTGLYSHQAGIGHMWRNFGTPAYQGYLNDRCVTLAEALRTAGYKTLMSGKWHVGAERPHWPCDRGFDESYAYLGGATNYFRPKALAHNDKQVAPTVGDGYYLTDDFSEQAVAMLDRHGKADRPFFLYLAYTAPHSPIQAPAEDVARHRGRYRIGWDELRRRRHRRMIDLGIVDKAWPLSPRPAEAQAWESVREKDEWDLRMAVYAAMIERMDRGVGRVLKSIRDLGAESNTLVLFLSDNGGCAESRQRGKPGAPIGSPDSDTTYELPWANASNTPFRYHKRLTHEGGISTPLIVSWPDEIGRGSMKKAARHVIDIMPTLLDAAGASYPGDRIPLEGQSLLPMLRGGRPGPERTFFWEHEGNRAVRQGDWKLVAGFKREWELYNMASDRTELLNLASKHPARVRELSALYDRWANRCGVLPWRDEWEERFGMPQ
jgi:arylsulfatase